MLKSTHKPQQAAPAPPPPPPLPPGWTEHKAPTGHSYYYHAETKKSTYQRPVAQPEPSPQQQLPPFNAPYIAPFGAHGTASLPSHYGGHSGSFHRGGGAHGGHDRRRQHQPEDRPKHKYAIPGCAPWVLVKTKLGRRFVHNPDTNESFWKFPADVLKGVVELDRLEREKKERREKGEPSDVDDVVEFTPSKGPEEASAASREESEEYEEVEVTDEEEVEIEDDEDDDEGEEGRGKRQRVDSDAGPVDFNEDDIAYQLAAMEQGYNDAEWDQGEEDALTEEDACALFRDLLEDYSINPFWTWEKVIGDGQIVEDDRYTVYSNTKSRKDAFDDWSRDKIQFLKEQKEKEAKKDPRIPYMALLQTYATPKLYWPEFKRKYRKEAPMRDLKIPEKDKEKWYREHINRLKLPQSTLKADLTALLKSLPLSGLNRSSTLANLPPALLADIKYISLSPSVRDALIETYISTLPPAPEDSGLTEEEEAEAAKKRAERERREKALAEREKRVREDKRRQQRELEYGKGRLREEERELEQAMRVGKQGLKSQLGYLDEAAGTDEKKSTEDS